MDNNFSTSIPLILDGMLNFHSHLPKDLIVFMLIPFYWSGLTTSIDRIQEFSPAIFNSFNSDLVV